MSIAKIVLTGGPCAGKTTALSLVSDYFEKIGWRVIVVSESATWIMLSGVRPADFHRITDFQGPLMLAQIQHEELFSTYADSLPDAKIMILYDRGICDCRAYLTAEQYEMLLRQNKLSDIEARERYDAVFHLVTAADGARDYYTTSNNIARLESVEEAISADHRTQNAWIGHPHLRIIGNSGSFEDKMRELIFEISNALGEPEPFEIERKYLIELPDLAALRQMPNCQEVEILQTYLVSNSDSEVRVRQRGQNGSYIFTQTTKRQTNDPARRLEVEKRISKNEYLDLLMQADPDLHSVRKTRFCILQRESEQYLEVDIYPGAKRYAILEVELPDVEAHVIIPNFITVVKEVTGNKAFYNHSIAMHGGRLPE